MHCTSVAVGMWHRLYNVRISKKEQKGRSGLGCKWEVSTKSSKFISLHYQPFLVGYEVRKGRQN